MLAHARLGGIVSVQQCCFVVHSYTLSFCFATMASTALSSAQPWKNARTGNAPSTASGNASDKAAGAASDKATGAASDQAARAASGPTPLRYLNELILIKRRELLLIKRREALIKRRELLPIPLFHTMPAPCPIKYVRSKWIIALKKRISCIDKLTLLRSWTRKVAKRARRVAKEALRWKCEEYICNAELGFKEGMLNRLEEVLECSNRIYMELEDNDACIPTAQRDDYMQFTANPFGWREHVEAGEASSDTESLD